MPRPDAVAQREDGGDVEQRVADDDRQRALDQGTPVPAEHLGQRHPHPLLPPHGFEEGGRLLHGDAQVEADADEGGADQERDAPGPGHEGGLAEPEQQRQEQAVGHEEAERRPELREHAEPGPAARRGVLGRQQGRAAPLAPEPDALAEAQEAQEPGRQGAGRGVAGQEADQEGRQAHHQHGGHEGRLAADPVAEMPEQHRADRAGHEGDAEGQEGVERLGAGRRLGEEGLPDDQGGGGAVDVEVVELDGGADEARQHDAAQSRGRNRRAARRRPLGGGADPRVSCHVDVASRVFVRHWRYGGSGRPVKADRPTRPWDSGRRRPTGSCR